MKRLKGLDRYQKVVLLLLAILVLVFTVLYPVTISREGFRYQDAILVPQPEAGGTVYAGKLRGEQARFTVSADKTVVFQYGERAYGPYTVREDPTAIPEGQEGDKGMTGIEVRKGEDIFFRGSVLQGYGDSHRTLFREDGSIWIGFTVTMPDGEVTDAEGNVLDPMEPSVSDILNLIAGPELAHKGDWFFWFGGMVICIVNVILVLFADELFRWNLAFQIRNPERAEPSDWAIASRRISWVILLVGALVVFILGLR